MTSPKDILRELSRGATFDRGRFRDALARLSEPDVTMPQQAAFLALLRGRGDTVEEITGAALLLRDTMLRSDAPADAPLPGEREFEAPQTAAVS